MSIAGMPPMTMEERENYDLPGQLQRARDLLIDIEIEQEILKNREESIIRTIASIEYRMDMNKE